MKPISGSSCCSMLKRSISCATGSKLGKTFLFTVCHISQIDGILSDVDAMAWLKSVDGAKA